MRVALLLALLALLGATAADGEAQRASRALLAGKASSPAKKPQPSTVDMWRHAMSVLTKMKNREIAQRASTGDTTAPVDCFEIDEHFSSTLDGSWRTKIDDTSLWDGVQCEDYASAPSAKAAACKAAPQALFRPDTCWLHEVIPVKFLSLLRGRTLWLWGDTVAKQQFTALRCQLSQRGRDGTLAAQRLLLPGYSTACEPDVRRADCAVGTDTAPPDAHLGILHLDPDWPGQQARGCVAKCDLYNLTSGGSARVCYVYADKAGLLERSRLPCWAETQPQDVVVANLGPLYEGPEGLGAAVGAFAGFWARSMEFAPEKVPLLIWRETAAAHFPGGKGDGNRNVESAVKDFLQKDHACAADLDVRAMEAGNWRNAVANKAIEALQVVPILRVFRPSARALGAWHFGFEASGSDCVHWCQGHRSVPESWNTLLFNMLSEEGAMHKFRARARAGAFPHPPGPPPLPPPLPPPPPGSPQAPDAAVAVHAGNAAFAARRPVPKPTAGAAPAGVAEGDMDMGGVSGGAAPGASAASAAREGDFFASAAPGGGMRAAEVEQVARVDTFWGQQQASKGRSEAFAEVLKTGIPTEKHGASVRNDGVEIEDWTGGGGGGAAGGAAAGAAAAATAAAAAASAAAKASGAAATAAKAAAAAGAGR